MLEPVHAEKLKREGAHFKAKLGLVSWWTALAGARSPRIGAYPIGWATLAGNVDWPSSNPAAHLIANQSKRLAELRRAGKLDGFSHVKLQSLLDELMTQQGKAERIKNW